VETVELDGVDRQFGRPVLDGRRCAVVFRWEVEQLPTSHWQDARLGGAVKGQVEPQCACVRPLSGHGEHHAVALCTQTNPRRVRLLVQQDPSRKCDSHLEIQRPQKPQRHHIRTNPNVPYRLPENDRQYEQLALQFINLGVLLQKFI